GVLALVLVAAGLALYEVFERDLDREIDDDLNTRSADVAALTARKQEPHFLLAGSGERIAQVYSADGRLLASTRQLGRSRLLSTAEVLRARRKGLRLASRETTREGAIRIR